MSPGSYYYETSTYNGGPRHHNVIFNISYNGNLEGINTAYTSSSGLRPVITLASTVQITSGDGSILAPYIILTD